ncbi:MAG: hypothetical protein R3E01_10270 [Pirellulaceae bacterium]
MKDVNGDGSVVAAVMSPQDAFWFDDEGSLGYVGRHGIKEELVVGTNELILCRPDGSVYTFYDFSQTNEGLLKSITSRGGASVSFTYNTDGKIEEVTRTSGSTTESFLYTYLGSTDDNEGELEEVLCRRKEGAGSWENVARCQYSYYDGTTSHGNLGDLEFATRQEWTGSAWGTERYTYYRYYKDSAGGTGYQYGLMMVVSNEGLDRSVTPTNLTDAQLKPYSSHYFEYDSSQRVTKEENDGGTLSTTFSYTTSGHSDGYNNWKQKTVETMPNGDQQKVYTNYVGQVLLRELISGTDSWVDYYVYNSSGKRTQHAMPSAVTSYNDTNADLGVSLKTSAGVIYVTDYYSTTTATSSTAGGAAGYVQYEKIKQGSSGSEIKLREYKYIKNTANSFSTYPVGEEKIYRSDASGGSDSVSTTYAYTFHSGTHQVSQVTTTLPAVPTAENGANSTDSIVDVFDTSGHRTWHMCGGGCIDYYEYDDVLGGLVKQIKDVDTTQTSDFSNKPSGWTTASGNGLHLISDYELDDFGRVTQALGPVHTIDLSGTATSVRQAQWTVYKNDGTEVRRSRGFREGSGTSGTIHLVNPVSITKLDRDGRLEEEIQAVRSTTNTLVTISESLGQSTYCRWTTRQYDNAGLLEWTRVYHNIPTTGSGSEGASNNYNQTDFDYDDMNRVIRRETPGGTIFRSVYDARANVVSEWVGTDDTGATDDDPDGSGGSNNMVKVMSYEYDDGVDGGDGNLTEQTVQVDASVTRTTSFTYDWRNRREKTVYPPDNSSRIVYNLLTLDNLGRVTRQESYEEAASGADTLLRRADIKYDTRGRVYQRVRYEVNSGTVGDHLTDNTWYDCCEHVMKEQAGGSELFTKYVYDGADRQTKVYRGFDVDETSYADAGTLTGDTILEHTETTYDAAGNVIQSKVLQRYHDDTSTTGSLTAGTSARVNYTAVYPDGIGRQMAVAAYGNQGSDSTSFTRSGTVPTRSDTVLVSETEYDDAGMAWKSIDPKDREDRTTFDDAGRVTSAIRNYTDGDPTTGGNDEDITVETTYTVDGKVATLTAKQKSSSDDQVTTYVYGTATGGITPVIYRNDLLRAEIYPDSDDPTSLTSNGTDGVYDRVEYKYNRVGEVIEKKDQNGTVHTYEYDKLGRLLRDKITTVGSGVDNAVLRIETVYDVRGNVEKVTSYDHATQTLSTNIVNQIVREYNGLNLLTKEYQEHEGIKDGSTPYVTYTYDESSDGGGELTKGMRPTMITYPNGRKVHYTYGSSGSIADSIARLDAIQEDSSGSPGQVLVSYDYLGFQVFAKVHYEEADVFLGADIDSDNSYAMWDRFGRTIDLLWVKTAYSSSSCPTTDLVHLQYGYDRASNRLYKLDLAAACEGENLDEAYTYDDVNRLVGFDRGDYGTSGISGTPSEEADWTLDPLGNWSGYVEGKWHDVA